MGLFNNKEDDGSEEQTQIHFCVSSDERTKEKEIEALSLQLKEIIENYSYNKENIVFLCIGSDKYVGDSLGPLVGTMLNENNVPYQIYGTLKEPVHSFNLKQTIKKINRQFKKPLIISIDACLGDKNEVGDVVFKEGPISPGTALKKVLPEVGDYHLKGMVNYIDPLPTTQFLNDTRLYTVMNLAKTITKVISQTVTENTSSDNNA